MIAIISGDAKARLNEVIFVIEFIIEEKKIELSGYSEDTTLNELVSELEAFRLKNRLKTRNCQGCGKCCKDNIPVLGLDLPEIPGGLSAVQEESYDSCIVLPEKPCKETRQKALAELQRTNGLKKLEASLIFEYNNAEPLILSRQQDSTCLFLKNKLCSVYDKRPYSCGLYLCNMGEKLSYIQEMIIRQGTWHAYQLLGWVAAEEISHNPFLKARSYDELLVREFDFDLEDALAQLFFYF